MHEFVHGNQTSRPNILIKRLLLGLSIGSFPQPGDSDPQLLFAWRRSNIIVSSWLLNSIAKEITVSVIYSSWAVKSGMICYMDCYDLSP